MLTITEYYQDRSIIDYFIARLVHMLGVLFFDLDDVLRTLMEMYILQLIVKCLFDDGFVFN
jgi:hypothetical protein